MPSGIDMANGDMPGVRREKSRLICLPRAAAGAVI